MKNVILCSDVGSGYKTNHGILGMRNMFHKAGISLICWYVNASGEGKISTTDGHNMSVKA